MYKAPNKYFHFTEKREKGKEKEIKLGI